MTGDSYHPISVYGYKILTFDELEKTRRIYKSYLEREANRIVTRSISNKPPIDIYYCMDHAYSRWEGMNTSDIFYDCFDAWGNSAFAVFGVTIDAENINKFTDIKRVMDEFKDEFKDFKVKESDFFNAILMYQESCKQDYGIESDEEDN